MDPRRLRAISSAAVAVSGAGVLAITLAPGGWVGPASSIPDAAWHAAAFAAFGASLALAYATSGAARRSPRRTLVMALLAIWIVAAGTELLQERIPGGSRSSPTGRRACREGCSVPPGGAGAPGPPAVEGRLTTRAPGARRARASGRGAPPETLA